ncbi:type II secretion system GspH family protein [Shewanella sp. D64]|uniref:PilW family protein n=1 Tax=unclassified Shewanella TaxID=196818 RepID=UPI0022BA4B74|nr:MULTISPECIES: type II secretion system protein [unclassified Shewanella]MEC4725451.1 type II secretion system GspH family protein [Shewanella sp. D64]MEC4738730.1 type II secretion system GspH family protein [Shewanella sp. E94]WBJ95024.1 type II secretion system GspH family protein [Shewanella sp. MTB7]
MNGIRGGKHGLGFTLVEMVTVIIILGILALGVSSFVVLGTRIFVESTSIEQVLGQSRFALERMTRELRNAVPNSIRLTPAPPNTNASYQCVEFVPIQASASYIELPFVPSPASLTGTVIPPSQGLNSVHQMLVYPLKTSDIYAATPAGTSGRLFDVKEFNQSSGLVTFDRAVRFAESSPIQRYFMINGPVSYCFQSDGTLWRYAGYGLETTQPTPSTMSGGALMAEDITNNLALVSDQPILLTPSSLVNNAMLQLTPTFSVNGQVFQYQHQVQVINVP